MNKQLTRDDVRIVDRPPHPSPVVTWWHIAIGEAHYIVSAVDLPAAKITEAFPADASGEITDWDDPVASSRTADHEVCIADLLYNLNAAAEREAAAAAALARESAAVAADRPLTPDEQQVADWLRDQKLAVESVRTLTGWTHQPVIRWPAQSPPAPELPRRVPPLRRRSDARPLPAAGLPPLAEAKPDDSLPGVVSGLIPLSTGEGQ